MLSVTPIEAFSDNYIWCLYRADEKAAFVVDPGDGNAVLKALAELDLELAGILITHHHFDHTGGLDTLLRHRDVPVFGPHNLAITQITSRLADGETAQVLGSEFEVITVPGHTLDHIAFYSRKDGLLFCGDTLFAGGCGRLFEGDAATMYQSLQRLAALPATTRAYCAHEYTLANLKFATAVEPQNLQLQARIVRDKHARDQNIPTVPSSLGLELETNPFLRCATPSVAAHMQELAAVDAADPVAVFAAVRSWKDSF